MEERSPEARATLQPRRSMEEAVTNREHVRSIVELVSTALIGLLVAAVFPAVTWPEGLALGLGAGHVRFVVIETGRRRAGSHGNG